MIEKPSKGRAIIRKNFNSLIIEIPSKKNWFIIIFMIVWMGPWVAGETSVIREIFRSETIVFANAFQLFWLAGWTFGGIMVIFSILRLLIGKERIIIERGIMTIKKSIFGIGRKRSYEIKSIKNLDINTTSDERNSKKNYRRSIRIKVGTIKFDYGMKTIRFANDIDEAEAKMIIEKLKKNTNFRDVNFAQHEQSQFNATIY